MQIFELYASYATDTDSVTKKKPRKSSSCRLWKDWKPMTDENVGELAQQLKNGIRWCYLDPNDPDIKMMISVAVMFGPRFIKRDIDKIGAVLGNMNKTAPRSINGKPMFYSIAYVHKEDWVRVLAMWKKLEEAEKQVLGRAPAVA